MHVLLVMHSWCMIWYCMIYLYDMIWYMIWYNIWYVMKWNEMIWYDIGCDVMWSSDVIYIRYLIYQYSQVVMGQVFLKAIAELYTGLRFHLLSSTGIQSLTHCGLVIPYGFRRSWLTWERVMACCLMAPNHYLNYCWLIINEVLWHSPGGNFLRNV